MFPSWWRKAHRCACCSPRPGWEDSSSDRRDWPGTSQSTAASSPSLAPAPSWPPPARRTLGHLRPDIGRNLRNEPVWGILVGDSNVYLPWANPRVNSNKSISFISSQSYQSNVRWEKHLRTSYTAGFWADILGKIRVTFDGIFLLWKINHSDLL